MKVKVIHEQEGCKLAGHQQPIPGKWKYTVTFLYLLT